MWRSVGVVVALTLMVLLTATAQETTTACPPIKCAPDCVTDIGPNRCPVCACPRTCRDVNCTEAEECVLNQIQCFRAPCFPIPTCRPRIETTTACPMYKCAPDCFPGKGPDGCPACDCPPTCRDVRCTENKECVLKQVVCKKDPCYPVPTCVPRNDSCSGTPNTKRCRRSTIRWFYNSSAGQCQKFSYYGCTPSPNTFLSRNACEGKCKKSCPEQDLCGIRCMYPYVLKTDKNGCQLCQCIEKPIPY